MEIMYKTRQANKASSLRNKIPFSIKEHIESVEKNSGKKIPSDQLITGSYQQCILFLMWLNILWIALKEFKNPFKAVRQLKALKQLRNQYRNGMILKKFMKVSNRFYAGYSIPGWPSKAFNRYVKRQFMRMEQTDETTLHTLIFGVTKKCGFQCEHCYEWNNLNKPETLSKNDLVTIVERFHQLGITQVQLSGGEPLNRLDDILHLLLNSPQGIDYWLYTTGYSLTSEKARLLKKAGLTGITISLDHHEEEKHDHFRGVKGAYKRALNAVALSKNEGLAVCFSLCATKEFISAYNLHKYAQLATQCGVAFIQILEPRPVGHYTGMDVTLTTENCQMLDRFYETVNYNPFYKSSPIIAYHGYYGRRMGCSGSGIDYVFVDTDGDIHNCPFCQQKLFSAKDINLNNLIRNMKSAGCSTYKASHL